MKTKLLLVAAIGLIGLAAVAQLRVTSFSPSGDLTWTNSVTNALYRVQWATNPAGPWNAFTTQTNLNSIQAHSNRVTVNAPRVSGDGPQFVRVGWSDAAPATGLYDLREYHTNGSLMVTGSLWLAGERGSARVAGTRNLVQVSGPPGYPGPQLGSDEIGASFYAPYAESTVSLTPYSVDNNVILGGYLVGNTFQGSWAWNTGGASPIHEGWFTATRAHCDPPPPPNPAGSWDYRTEPGAMRVLGMLTFATNGCSTTGTWYFSTNETLLPSTHLLGQGSFTNVAISENSVTITIPAGDTTFELKGVMASEFYVGFVEWGTNNVPMGLRETGLFWARRK